MVGVVASLEDKDGSCAGLPVGNKDDVNDSSQFQSYYIIKAAQRREELTRRGDELDSAIRQSERELRAQQLTLDHLNARNIAFRDSFKKVDKNSDENEVRKGLFRLKYPLTLAELIRVCGVCMPCYYYDL